MFMIDLPAFRSGSRRDDYSAATSAPENGSDGDRPIRRDHSV
jgi:hypothetical protein